MMKIIVSILLTSTCALTSLSTNPVGKLDSFDAERFLGKWYEIGRTFLVRGTINLITATFERNCECVTANVFKLIIISTFHDLRAEFRF